MIVTDLIAGAVGIAMLIAFLGFLVVWINALPLTIIVIGVVALLLIDFVQTLRAERRRTRANQQG